jgi:hypothetical protein
MSNVKKLADWLEEAKKRKKVVRGGKRQVRITTDRPGYKIVWRNGKPVEVRMSPQEIKKRQKASKRGARKRKGKAKSIARKRKISLKKKENYFI